MDPWVLNNDHAASSFRQTSLRMSGD